MNICPICNRRTLQHSRKNLCRCCKKFIHQNCSGLLKDDFEMAVSEYTWLCRLCVEQLFPFNHLDDDNDFTKCIIEMSHYSDFPTRLHDRNVIFNPFEINDDNNYIIEYQGDLDPNKYYFNEYSEKLIRNCN